MIEYIYVTEEFIGYNTKDKIPNYAFLLGEYKATKYKELVACHGNLTNINNEHWES